MSYRVHNLGGCDVYFDTQEEAQAAIDAEQKGATVSEPETQEPAEKPREEDETP